ncbi:fumarylacetoacetate hydrolase family protein [Halotalea alkalilenta]|uniref:Isomerase/hydrolase n=1 Tax=Halotalea alkalilenta TaxID=376489 RepID=A0A172YCY4_9GAMM|nr:fumarylacetoacetate hydrolase family protein [Halotalea alkalilenta]ANF56855.1 isomerase/hydrolase [Halotalea alkalilenta]
MAFILRFEDGRALDRPLGKIVCVGRNYAAHAHELDNPVPEAPLIFIKPATSAIPIDEQLALRFDLGEIHYEAELAVLITAPLSRVAEHEVASAIGGIGLALDLTLRDVQSELKAKGYPWELAKAFDGACPLGPFIAVDGAAVDWRDLRFGLDIDDESRQRGHSAEMLFPVLGLIAHMSQRFTLEPGDVVLTGTPKGVGKLAVGQRLRLTLGEEQHLETRIV